MSERRTYRFGPLERRGLLGPVRAGQAAILAIGALLAVAALDGAPSAAGALVSVTALALAIAAATLPVAGRSADEWAPVLAAFILRGARGRTAFRSRRPAHGLRSAPSGGTPLPAPVEPPPGLRDVELIDIPYHRRQLGVLAERDGRRLCTVLACRVLGFALLDPDAQARRLAHWGDILATLPATPIRRLQWIERTVPAPGDELARWLHSARDPTVPLRGVPMIESYLELIETSARVTHEHEILIVVQIDAERARDRSGSGAKRTVIEETERIARLLEAAEVHVVGALSGVQLARVLRTAFDPYAQAELTALEAADRGRSGPAPAEAWPIAVRESWDHVRCDGALHATYWIAGWPRTDVSPMFMNALLGRSESVRAVAVTFEPIPPARSTREVEAAITRDRADSELRRRFGQSETARQRQSHEAAVRRETELAAGHCEVRLAGFVTVSGRDEEELRGAAASMIEDAARARLELRRLYGQQASAFTFTLPLARGLR